MSVCARARRARGELPENADSAEVFVRTCAYVAVGVALHVAVGCGVDMVCVKLPWLPWLILRWWLFHPSLVYVFRCQLQRGRPNARNGENGIFFGPKTAA